MAWKLFLLQISRVASMILLLLLDFDGIAVVLQDLPRDFFLGDIDHFFKFAVYHKL